MISDAKKRASIRLNYEIIQMKKYMQINKISNVEVSKKSGITTPNVWRFINRKSQEPSALTFLMIAEAIGYEISINLKTQL